MPTTINTNMLSLNAQRNLSGSEGVLRSAMQRLSSGLRVNGAKDDAAGIAIASRMDAQARGMAVAIRNANDAVSLVQTAEGALATIAVIFQRMRELAVQSANATNGSGDRTNLNTEFTELSSEVTRIKDATKFNGTSIIASGGAGSQAFQVGADASQTLTVTTVDAATYLATPGDVTSATNANTAIGALDTAITSLNTDRAKYGAALNRLQFTISNLQNGFENQTAARARIMDADYAVETANLTRAQVLQQAGTAMLAQANAAPNMVLSLLK